jgi:hypothetical protein
MGATISLSFCANFQDFKRLKLKNGLCRLTGRNSLCC